MILPEGTSFKYEMPSPFKKSWLFLQLVIVNEQYHVCDRLEAVMFLISLKEKSEFQIWCMP